MQNKLLFPKEKFKNKNLQSVSVSLCLRQNILSYTP